SDVCSSDLLGQLGFSGIETHVAGNGVTFRGILRMGAGSDRPRGIEGAGKHRNARPRKGFRGGLISRILSKTRRSPDDHFSGTPVARRLERPTRKSLTDRANP